MSLNGIDISSWQSGIDISAIDGADFVIVKVTGGTGYVNDDWRRQAEQTLESGKLLGLYHYAWEVGSESSAADEAQHFLDTIGDFEGSFIPALDVEAGALDLDQSWSKEWMDIVSETLGSDCLFYTGGNAVESMDWSSLTDYKLWIASYLYRNFNTDFLDDPDRIHGPGQWDEVTIYQYSSTGDVDGYDGNLDLNVFYGDREDWESMATGGKRADTGLRFRAHSQNKGWGAWKSDGETAGTVGESLRLEAIQIDPPEGYEMRAKAHIQNVGWKTFDGIVHGNNVVIGTTGESKRIEMLSLETVKKPEGAKDVSFRVHQQDVGWKAWTGSGYASGTDGESTRLEAVQISIA